MKQKNRKDNLMPKINNTNEPENECASLNPLPFIERSQKDLLLPRNYSSFNSPLSMPPRLTALSLGTPSTLTSLSAGSAATLSSLAIERKDIEDREQLLKNIESLSKKLLESNQGHVTLEQNLFDIISEYEKKEKIKYIQGKIAEDARESIQLDNEFLDQFAPEKNHEAFVVSIDIRSSTELMLNAKSPNDFASFITELCKKLNSIIIDNGGIFDKFTGDGVLAFFPIFYSGDDAGYRAILAANDAIDFFNEHYYNYRKCFRVVRANTGLGVGIDFGTVQFVNIGESLSVVGNPVVYACRLSSTDANTICVNQPAQEILENKYKAQTIIEEKTIDIKNSGPVYAYQVRLKGDPIKPAELPWRKMSSNDPASLTETSASNADANVATK
ncbi:MAG: adenylate/guanylate cyclase domain-containing protein [Candidatus Latescibacterota bacterium]